MRIHKQFFKSIALTTLLSCGFAAYGIAQDKTTVVDPEAKAPVILSTSPGGDEMNVDLGSVIMITFNVDMDENTINENTLLLHATSTDTMREVRNEVVMDDQIRDQSAKNDSKKSWQNSPYAVNGTISYSNKVAVFTPSEELKEGTSYTFTVTSEVKSAENVALENDQNWSFKTNGSPESAYSDKQSDKQNDKSNMEESENRSMDATSSNKQKNIDLGKAGEFVILAKKDVNNESGSNITGHIGKGSEAENNRGNKDTQNQNNDQKSVMQSDQSDGTSSPNVTEAIEGLESAYSGVSMHQSDEEVTNHNTESFHHDPALKPGVHVWDSSIEITSDVTLSGSADDVWVFKTGDDLTVSENTVITLADGARADNIYWYVEGEASIGKNAEFEGIILSKDEITLEQGAIVNGRMFSQTSITLDDNTITEPRKMTGSSETAYSDKQSDKQNNKSNMEESENNRSMNATSTNEKKVVDLGKAGEFVILAKKDVNNESGSNITGHIGQGSEAENNKGNKDTQNNDRKSVMQSDQSDGTSSPNVTEAIEGLESAYSGVSMHQSDEEVTNHNTKSFDHDPALKPGVHVWDSSIDITSDVTLSGSEDDVWIFKTSEDLTVSENTVVTLVDGARADNIYWYVEGEVSIGKNAEFEGIILSMDEITLEQGAIVNGRMFSQASITLDDNTITEPRKMTGQTTSKDE